MVYHKRWCILIGPSIVFYSKPLFYHSDFPLCLRNVVLYICTIRVYFHLISHFIHNLFKLAVIFNVFNGKYYVVVMSHYYIQSPVELLFCYIGKWHLSLKTYLFVNCYEQLLFIDEHNVHAQYHLLIIFDQILLLLQ